MLEEKESFWKKKGFYLSACAAILCVLAIGTVYYRVTYQNNNGKNLFADSATTAPSDSNNNASSNIAGGSAIEEDSVSVAKNNTQQNTSSAQPDSTPTSTLDSSANNQDNENNQTVDNNDQNANNDSQKNNTPEKYVADANTKNKEVALADSAKTTKTKDSKTSKEKQDNSKKSANKTDNTNNSDNTVATMKDTSTKNKFDMEKGLLWPVTGDIVLKYSMSNTIYFKTLAQYKCNPAIIISSKEGTDVKAAADGTVSKVAKSDEIGNLVTVDIGNGYSVTYGQLDGISVKEGQYIKEGSIIAQIAKPTKYYSEEGSNLYLQVTENDKPVDPMLLLR